MQRNWPQVVTALFLNHKKNNPDSYCEFKWGSATTLYVMISGISGDKDEFESGEYIVQYNHNINTGGGGHTSIRFMTPNGIFTDGSFIPCNSPYRSEHYSFSGENNPSCLSGYLVSALVLWREFGEYEYVRVQNPAENDIREYAAKSQEYNLTKLADIRAMFVQDEV